MGIKKDKLSEVQKQEIERLRQFVARFRFKCVTDAAEPPLEWDQGFPENIPLYNSIEWLELDPAGAAAGGADFAGGNPGKRLPDFGEALKRALAGAGIPVAEGGPGIRIIGYARNGGKG